MKINLIKFLVFVTAWTYTSSLQSQNINLTIHAPKDFQTAQLLTYDNPFDGNLRLLTDLTLTDAGKFEYSFTEPEQIKIAIKLGELTRDLILNSGESYEFTIETKASELPIATGYLSIVKINTTDKVAETLFSINKDITVIGNQNKKNNGKYSENYYTELFNYWKNLLVDQKNELEVGLVNSTIFASSASTLKKAGRDNEFKILERLFEKNFTLTPAGLQALQSMYVTQIWLDYALRFIGKIEYLQFIDQELEKIKNKDVQSVVELALVADAIGTKWANQSNILKRLQSIIDKTPEGDLKEFAIAIQTLHSSQLIGKEIENFKSLAPNGDTILFSDFKGKYLLIDFWATWCGPCVKSMRKLPDLKKEMNGKLEVLCITFEVDKEKVERFIEKNNYKDALTFGFAMNKKIMDSYFDIRAIPLYYLVSPDGVVIDKAVGEPFEILKKHLK